MTFVPRKYVAGDGLPEKKSKCKCPQPRCGLWVWFGLMTNIEALAGHLTLGRAWACDGCLAGWVRNSAAMGRGKVASEYEFAKAWGAPQGVLDDLAAVLTKRLARNIPMAAQHALLKARGPQI